VRVEVRLFATLLAFLPPDSRDGAALLEMPDGSTVRDAVRRLGIPADFERVTLLNGADSAPDAPLHAGDVLTVFPPLAGGQEASARPVV
jgi:molybdopterin converting factor small subunit